MLWIRLVRKRGVVAARAASMACAAIILAACVSDRIAGAPQAAAPFCAERLTAAAESFDMSLDIASSPVPTRIWHPARTGAFPVIAFSHGAFASPERYDAMLRPIAAAGFVVIAPTHPDSETLATTPPPGVEDVWRQRLLQTGIALDPPAAVRAALGEAGVMIDPDHSFLMGHSYGALVAQVHAGATVRGAEPFAAKAKAVVAWSRPVRCPAP